MKLVRASSGTQAVLGMELMFMDAPPTTAYLQIYSTKHCLANCLFCSQARDSQGELKHIARGQYLPADLNEVVRRLGIAFEKKYVYRVCIQTAMYPDMWEDTVYLIRRIKNTCNIPISVSVFPLDDAKYHTLQELGVDHLVIPLDAATPELFYQIKGAGAQGPFSWDVHMDGLIRAATLFPHAGTHIIVGMGETDQDVIELIGRLYKKGIQSALFAYTPLSGTSWTGAKPDIRHYRRVQLAAYLIRKDIVHCNDLKFENGVVTYFGLNRPDLEAIIRQGEAFLTTGCPHCNRPYATETHDPVYNYPLLPDQSEITLIKQQLGIHYDYEL
jgi:biotin synthase-related radical SAM superfamily protein